MQYSTHKTQRKSTENQRKITENQRKITENHCLIEHNKTKLNEADNHIAHHIYDQIKSKHIVVTNLK